MRWRAILALVVLASGCAKSHLYEEQVLCVEVPAFEPPTHLDATFVAQLQNAEVTLLIDQTGSMDGEINEIRDGLVSEVIPAMQEAFFGDLRLGIAGFGDFPRFPYGVETDQPFVRYQPITGDMDAIERATRRLMPDTFYGNDEPEAQIPALHHLATNEGHPEFLPPSECPPGTVGAACWGEAARVVLLFTDASFHNGPGDVWPYGYPLVPRPPSYAQTVEALNEAGIRVIVLWSGFAEDSDPALAIAGDTGARNADGMPLVIDIGLEGEGLNRGVADAVRDLVAGALLDVDAVAVDPLDDDVDATRFVRDISPLVAEPAEGAVRRDEGFIEVRPGTQLTFRLTLQNDRFEARAEPQIYPLDVHYRDRGLSALGTQRVLVVVPSISGVGCEAVDG
jgi:hypothetical protein